MTTMNKTYKLEIDPRILELLGPSLYTNIYYVLAELIANAYDAMAHNVYIISNKDEIIVEDDGCGMSYENGDFSKYLEVARESRISEGESKTRDGKRLKMGRKGVGKLAALSVSRNVWVQSRCENEVSGCILSRTVPSDKTLKALDESEIVFHKITGNGSSIIMKAPEYRFPSELKIVKKNLLKIFPAVNDDFCIHIIRGNQEEILNEFDSNVMGELCSIVTLGDEYKHLAQLVMQEEPERQKLVVENPCETSAINMVDKQNNQHEYQLEIKGWLGAYKTTRSRKAQMTDFPDNFISIYANNKMGEFNILPVVGQNKLNEVYVVGQLHIDLFELTELPDMALSNRQGYKTDDPRYQKMLEIVRGKLLPQILSLRDIYSDLQSREKKKKKEEKQREKEEELRKQVHLFQDAVVEKALDRFANAGHSCPQEAIEGILRGVLNENNPPFGLKQEVDSLKRKILISQTWNDKPLADIVYKMLRHNNVPAEVILYTNCDDDEPRIPEGEKVYEYLREFFVESYSTQKIFVLFITSENTKRSWGALTEVGAAWITQIDHKIFNIDGFRPEHPLDDEKAWQCTHRDSTGLWMNQYNATEFCRKIEAVCDKLQCAKETRESNMKYLETLVTIKDNEIN